MPSINCDSARDELYKCLEQSDAAKKDNLSAEDLLDLPAESFPSECAALKKAFDDCVKAAEAKN